MKKTKMLLAVLFLAIITTIIAGCGNNSTSTAPGALAVTTASPLPAATIGTAYSQTLAASGGTAPYTWALATGSCSPRMVEPKHRRDYLRNSADRCRGREFHRDSYRFGHPGGYRHKGPLDTRWFDIPGL